MAVMFSGVKSIRPLPFASDWSTLKELLSTHEERAIKTEGALWSPVQYYTGALRGSSGVRFVESFVVDMDGEGFEKAKLDGLEWFAYSTHSHRVDDPRYHLVLPLAERVPASLWRAVWHELHERLGLAGDPATKDVGRIYFLPQHAPGERFEFHEGSGALLDVDFSYEVSDLPRQKARSSQRRLAGAGWGMMSEAWWDQPADVSRYIALEGKERYQLMLKDFRALMSEGKDLA